MGITNGTPEKNFSLNFWFSHSTKARIHLLQNYSVKGTLRLGIYFYQLVPINGRTVYGVCDQYGGYQGNSRKEFPFKCLVQSQYHGAHSPFPKLHHIRYRSVGNFFLQTGINGRTGTGVCDQYEGYQGNSRNEFQFKRLVQLHYHGAHSPFLKLHCIRYRSVGNSRKEFQSERLVQSQYHGAHSPFCPALKNSYLKNSKYF